MKTEPVFLNREAVELIHQASLRQFGGADGIRDENALESALAQPLHEYFYRGADLFQLAAVYAYHIAENQPFVDGNKRAALLSALNFLHANGIVADRPTDEFYEVMIAISAKRLDKAGLAEVFRRQLSAADAANG
jgi:death-on-curing protein